MTAARPVCKKHPSYNAKRYPRSECPTCLKIYRAAKSKRPPRVGR